MTNMSFSEEEIGILSAPFSTLMYRDIGDPAPSAKKAKTEQELEEERLAAPGLTAAQLDDLLTRVRNEAIAQTEQRLRNEYEPRLQMEAQKIVNTIETFRAEQKDYFSRVEAEVVQLALAIAGKILHREGQVDPMLIAALVRIAVEKLHDGSKVTIRIAPAEADKWRQYFANPLNGSTVDILEDPNLSPADCILETDLGSANFSIDGQLKEVEQGFFDLLAQRPGTSAAAATNSNSNVSSNTNSSPAASGTSGS